MIFFKFFPVYLQYDAMDCGPASLAAVTTYYGKKYSIQQLREYCSLSKDGVSLLGIEDAAIKIGFQTLAVKVSVCKLYKQHPLPCILHWDDSHFVVLYDIRKSSLRGQRFFYLSDPNFGRIKLNEKQFYSHWCGADGNGIALLMTPTDRFYELKPNKIDKHQKLNLISFIRKFKREYSILFWGMFFSSLFTLIFPFLTQSLIDIGINSKDVNIVTIFLLAQLVLFIGTTIITIVRNWALLYCNSILNIDIISNFIAKIIMLPFKFYDTKQLGDFTSRIDDHNRIQHFLTSSSVTVMLSLFNFAVYFILLIYYSKTILLVYLGITVLSILWSIYYVNKEKRIDYSRFRMQRDAQQNIYEIINGITEIKLNGIEKYKLNCWTRTQIKLFNIDVRLLNISQLESLGFESFNKLKDIIIVFMAACDVIAGNMSLGTLLAISYIIGSLNTPISQIIDFIRNLQYARLSYDRLSEVKVLQEEDDNSTVSLLSTPSDSSKCIHLKNIEFHYSGPRSPKVLDDITLDIPFGKTTAIVGESGSGKTTLMKILLKFYADYTGDIWYAGTNLRDLTSKSLRSSCGVVMQDGYIFSDTLERNIATGSDEINQDLLKSAISIAHLENFIKTLPQGLKTTLGTGGNGISGGQRQRILIARAVYKNPSFILFDEATSSLDAMTENKIYHSLEQFLQGRTVIKIAHRLSTVKKADQIIVLQNGKIVERGNHVELITQKGYYYNLVRNQLELGN